MTRPSSQTIHPKGRGVKEVSCIGLCETETKTVFEIVETRPSGVPDVIRKELVFDSVTGRLHELLPRDWVHSVRGELAFWTRSSILVGFCIAVHKKSSWGPDEEHVIGPYHTGDSMSPWIAKCYRANEPLVWANPAELASTIELVGARLIPNTMGLGVSDSSNFAQLFCSPI